MPVRLQFLSPRSFGPRRRAAPLRKREAQSMPPHAGWGCATGRPWAGTSLTTWPWSASACWRSCTPRNSRNHLRRATAAAPRPPCPLSNRPTFDPLPLENRDARVLSRARPQVPVPAAGLGARAVREADPPIGHRIPIRCGPAGGRARGPLRRPPFSGVRIHRNRALDGDTILRRGWCCAPRAAVLLHFAVRAGDVQEQLRNQDPGDEMRSNLMCILASAVCAAGWWWLTKDLVVAGVSFALGAWSLLRSPKGERTAVLIIASSVVPGFFIAIIRSLF